MLQITGQINFPKFSNVRCLMMPYIQGEPDSLPEQYASYRDIVSTLYYEKGDIGFLTIDESQVTKGKPHRGARAKTDRALHTEAGKDPVQIYCWGSPSPGYGWGSSSPTPSYGWGQPAKPSYGWGSSTPNYGWGGPPVHNPLGWGSSASASGTRRLVTLDRDTKILIASNLDNSCAVWNAEHEDTSEDGDIGHASDLYPYSKAVLLKAGEVASIGILTPHESLPVQKDFNRQFLRIISSGVHGREPYFTQNPLVSFS